MKKFKAAMKKTDDKLATIKTNIAKWEQENATDPTKISVNDKKIQKAEQERTKLLNDKVYIG